MTLQGLSSAEVAQRKKQGQTNSTPHNSTRSYSGIVYANLFSVFNIAVFFTAGVLFSLYLSFRDIRTLYDSIAISSVALVNTMISIVQEVRAKRALDRIIAMSQATATVVREGKEAEIPTDEIVKDDIIHVRRGDPIPVDGRIVQSHHCEVDESLLTGESEYIFKEEGANVLSGSFCVAGRGWVLAEKLGAESYIHQITHQVKSYKRFVSPLQAKIDRIVQVLLGIAVVMALLVVGQSLVGHSIKHIPANIIETTRSIASIVTSMIPVGLILLSTVAFALGVFRMSQRGALIQKLNAVESFANVDTICMDKTGTLTRNQLKFSHLTSLTEPEEEKELPDLVALVAHHSSEQNATILALTDAFEPDMDVEVFDEIPFNSKDKYSGLSCQKDGKTCHLILGALESLSPHLSKDANAKAEAIQHQQKGFRNLILATLADKDAAEGLKVAMQKRAALKPLALLSLNDEIRPAIESVLQQFYARDIQLKIISGDAAETVLAVAKAAGWKGDTSRVVTGDDLDHMSPVEVAHAASFYSLFARVSPSHKKNLITALQEQGRYVAMVGDGVNDVLALKQAELGVAMGSGNRMSRDVSDIVLLHDDFTIMPQVFEEGETILSNIQASAKLFLTKNANAVIAILCAGFLGIAFPFVPRHVTIIGFFSISVPALLLTFSRRIRYIAPNFLQDVLRFATLSGAFIATSGLLGFLASRLLFQQSIEIARTALLTQLVLLSITNFLLILGQDKFRYYWRENKPLVGFAFGFVALYFLLLWSTTHFAALAPLAQFLELYPLSTGDLITAAILTPIMATGMILTHAHIIQKS